MDISQKTLKTIEEKKITPEPRWHFLLKDYSLWFFFVFSVILGAMAVSAVLFMLTDSDWDVYEYLDRTLFEHVFVSMPYLWISILLFLLFIAYYNFEHTRRGYKYEIYKIIWGSVLISIVLGILLFFGGLGETIHGIFSRQVPFYNNIVYDKNDVWDNPQKGLLSGEIMSIENENEFLLRDFRGNVWQIRKEESLQCLDRCFDESLVQTGMQIKLIGQIGTDSVFFVKAIRPWYKR
ncbi:MAG: hypothetical protein PHE52_02450 [Candidatus Pacebacteria bacterium]|nr:hypothetical protein [Candidatus Paceibacterota bacterium]